MDSNNPVSSSVIKDNFFILLLSVTCLFSIAIGEYFLFSRNKHLLNPPPIAATPTPNPSTEPVVISPRPGDIIKSPLTVEGTVPSGWMFEGVIPIKIVDEYGNLIVQGLGSELTPGSWQSGIPIDFEGVLEYTTTAKKGFVVLEKDNPSGLPENGDKYEIPVNFEADASSTCKPRPACLDREPRCLIPETDDMCPPPQKACTMEALLCPDGKTYVGRSGPNCEFAPCPK